MKTHPFFRALPAVALIVAACPRPGAAPSADRDTPSGETLRAAVDAVLPAVVFIQVEASPHPLLGLPGPRGPLELPDAPPRVGAGSGILLSSDGHILTSDHVVQEADRVMVTLHDRRRFEARVVARDPSTDVAVLKIEGNGFPVAVLGDSDELHAGDWVLALGSPLGLEFSVTAGIVSGKGRSIGILGADEADGGVAAPLEHFIQTDAAINPGNSGGPLVNLAGEVVGINTAIATATGFFAGYGFAVPINLAQRVAQQLVELGHVRRAFLGVLLDEVTPADARAYGLESTEGAEVIHVQPDGPAARAGVELGDVIVGIDDRAIESVSELQAILATREPGTTATLRIVRFGSALDVPVEFGLIRSGVTPEPPPPVEGQARVGFAVAEEAGALIVARVRPYSRAMHAGVRPGQVIRSVNRQPVSTARDFMEAMRATRDGVVTLIVEDPAIGETIINFELRP